jgi:signal transduction histidine kinase/CheY-like chemotaxis protein/PAS domain-containing protein
MRSEYPLPVTRATIPRAETELGWQKEHAECLPVLTRPPAGAGKLRGSVSDSKRRVVPAFLQNAGETGRLIAAHDWSASLGSVHAWPESLRTAVGLLLRSPVPIVLLWGEDGIMIYNDAYSVFAGGRHPQLLGGKVREGWAEVAEFNDNVMRVGLAGRTLTYKDQQLTLQRSGQPEPVWMDLYYSPVLGEDGRPAGVIAIVVETTERVRAEAALRENERRLRFLDELARATTISGDADELLATTTRMVGEHLGLSNCAYADMDEDEDGFTIRGNWAAPGSPSIVGHYSLADFGVLAVRNLRSGLPLIVNDNLSELAPEEAATFQAIGITATICMPLIKEGRLTALMAIHDKVPHYWSADELALIREVTERSWAHIERVRAEAELRVNAEALAALNATLEERVGERTGELMRAEEALRQAQKMEAVGQLTGGLAHDFNNLLTGIGGSLEMVQTRAAQGRIEDIGRYLTAAGGAVKRAAALTHRLLAFSRRQTLDPKPTDVNRLVADMEELIRRSVGPLIHIEVVRAGGLWSTLVDTNQLENTLLNLCINARDAMPDGGRITIETANVWLDEREASRRDLPRGQYISLCVTDTGTGMTPEVIARAFDPFFTTKPIGEGTGLGLSMVYGFARQSGGQVRIYSELGQGTTVCLYLPRNTSDPEPEAAMPPAIQPEPNGGGSVVLVVDDEPTIRMLLSEVLQEFGYVSLEAADGPAGLKLLESGTKIDLLITDVGLPGGINGRQMADAARVRRPNLKVLFITGYAENAVLGNGLLEADMHLITKPFTMEAIAERIRQVMKA